MNCPYCNTPIPFNVSQCPGCGAPVQQQTPPQQQFVQQNQPQAPVVPAVAPAKKDGLWMSIVSLVFGILALLCALDDDPWDRESAIGFFMFVGVALGCGIPAVIKKKALFGMGIAGIATAAVAVLCAL